MILKKSTDFVVQINRLLKYAGFESTSEVDGTSVTMIDAEIVVALRPMPFVPEFSAMKKEIGT